MKLSRFNEIKEYLKEHYNESYKYNNVEDLNNPIELCDYFWNGYMDLCSCGSPEDCEEDIFRLLYCKVGYYRRKERKIDE